MLNKEVYSDTEGDTLSVKVVFLKFPIMEMKQRSKDVKDEEIYVYEFNNGQSIHFSMDCEELVKKMKRVPVSIGVFKPDDSFPICSLRTYLSGCACDMATKNIEDPVPFKFRGPFELIDAGQNFAGQLDLELTVFNLGRCISTCFALAPNCVVFKTDLDEPEYKCNIKDPSGMSNPTFGDGLANTENLRMVIDPNSPGNLMKTIAGISPAFEHLGEGSPPPKPPREPLFDPATLKGKKGKKKGKK